MNNPTPEETLARSAVQMMKIGKTNEPTTPVSCD
jgi:hypothetical protein